MGAYKWDLLKTAILPLPFLFLAAWLAGLPLPLPSLLLPERRYLALGRDISPEAFAAARGRGEAFASLPDRLSALPAGGAALEAARLDLPELPSLAQLPRDIESALGPFRKARVLLGAPPLAGEIEELRAAAARAGVPLAVESIAPAQTLPIQAVSRRYVRAGASVDFQVLLAPSARSLARVELALAGATGTSGRPPRRIYSSAGAQLPADLVLRLTAPRAEASSILISFVSAAGERRVRTLDLGADAVEEPRVLVVGDKKASSFIESLYPTRRATPAEAATLDLYSFELVVLDGLPMKSLRGSLLSGLQGLAARRTGSLLFVADSPEFGVKGDNPALEELLPAILLPRSLKDLPDLAILLLIDISGSMFGDKLSLAKVTGLELLRNLKSGDLVGLELFSDERDWAYDFRLNSSIRAAPVLEPVTARGGTDLYPALVEGLDRLARQPVKDKHVVLISDGVTRPADFQALAERARSRGITISAMGVGEDANRPLLERLALRTGGRYYRVGSADEIPALLFEDRTSVARPSFRQGRIPVLAINGDRVAEVGGMAQYTPSPAASVIFANELGDPLLASREYGNRAVLLFASDIYGTYTSGFFSKPDAAGAFKDRLDALFADRPVDLSVTEAARGLTFLARSDRLAAPRLLLTRAGQEPLDIPFARRAPGLWAAEAAPPALGRWNGSIGDRGGTLASFPVPVNGGLGGARADGAAALSSLRPAPFRMVSSPALWLLLFFASSLAGTVVLRLRR